MTEPIYKIANCRGKNPVIRDIVKAIRLLSNARFELNDCKGKKTIDHVTHQLIKDLRNDNPKITI